MTIHEALKAAEMRLTQAGVPDAAHDAGWLMGSLLGLSRLETLARAAEPLDAAHEVTFEALLKRREAREPLQYILGETSFMGRRVLCRPPVLIPRNDTESLCEYAIYRLKPGGRALDLCCGSGVIALSLKLACPKAEVHASDLSNEALALSRDNAALHRADITLHQGDLFAPLRGLRFDLICSNPPYIPTRDLAALQPELRHEPALALDGGEDGLCFYRRIMSQAPVFLNPGGWLMLEIGDGQAGEVRAMANVDFDTLSLYDDYHWMPRVLTARWKGSDAFSG